ncbi:BgTH12-07411 [Blumeria graminis f. sp. triticale]|uniref:BgTH12-07411 n=1 Tax=Blumeria graminis f. sp. triticale TaxID=1689686 RepID=A0A9W4GDA1_BLUGR|nr:BgTH12-07411 [Blumeria graminis f. sp. triticale]
MVDLLKAATVLSSLCLRLVAYIFLRWIPGHHFPPLAYSLFLIYASSFFLILNRSQRDTEKHAGNVSRRKTTGKIRSNAQTNNPAAAVVGRHANLWRLALSGLPCTKSITLALIVFSINLALLLGVTDLVYRARILYPNEGLSFTRLGFISSTEAKLLVRDPDTSHLPISLSYRPASDIHVTSETSWQVIGTTITHLGNETDFTGVIHFPLLEPPGQKLEWMTSNNHTGSFTIPPKPGQVLENGAFTFFVSSCIKARFPYNPMDHALAFPGLRHMSRVLKSFSSGRFMLFLGDFIYIDVPKRFGISAEDYRREYRQVYASPDWLAVGQNLSWIHVLDDHEIANDWDRHTSGVYKAAIDPWNHYHSAVNPPVVEKATNDDMLRETATYFEFTQGPASFFLLDTRTYRSPSRGLQANDTRKTMLGPQQISDLKAFLEKPEEEGVRWKFIISSIPFTKNWRVNSLDTWAGYLHERRVLLEAMWDVNLRGGVGVVVLSGDRHEFAATKFPPPSTGRWPASAAVYEYSVSPMSQFYLPVSTYRQTDNEDVEIRYIPKGNSKMGVISIEKTSHLQSSLQFKLFVDGEEVWSNIIFSPPTKEDDLNPM